jgi:hypothetical protein
MALDSSAPKPSSAEPDIEYIRRVYDRIIDWYKVAEGKAQLILAGTGVLVTVVAGTAFGKVDDARTLVGLFGVETWGFLGISLLAFVGAVICATRCLVSLHGRVMRDFAELKVDPAIRDTYRPEVLWYFGHLASLPKEAAVAALREADRQFEFTALAYNAVNLAYRVLRKHRLINAGWTLAALAIYDDAGYSSNKRVHT